MKIANGPFKGTSPGEGEIRKLLDHAGQPVNRDGKEVQVWGVHHRTRHALEKFPPEQGWGIRITGDRGPFNMADPLSAIPSANGETTVPMQPTMQFTAQLVSPEGNVVAEATVLRVINSYASWQAGQTSARGALYDALGLSVAFDDDEGAGATPQNGKQRASAITPIEPSARPSKLPQQAQAMLDAAEATAADSTTMTSATDVPHDAGEQPGVETSAEEAPLAKPAASKPAKEAKPAAAKTANAAPAVNTGINQNLLRQAQNRAKLLGREFPEIRDNDHLREVYKSLCASSVNSAAA